MAKYYTIASLSERLSETPEGFLLCEGVAITRSGDLLYSPLETPVTPGDGNTVISRTVEDIHDPTTIASFEGKPVTINHPDDFVTPENWRALTVGIVQNVRPGEGEDADKLLADLLITDHEAIDAVKSKRLREVSCGYEAEYVEISPGHGRQENIIGNHVALVDSGRCGSECAILDHAPKESVFMTMKEKFMGIFTKSLDEAMAEESQDQQPDMEQTIAAILGRLDAIEAALNTADGSDPAVEEEAAEDAGEVAPTLEQRVETVEQALAKLAGIEDEAAEEEEKAEDVCKDAETVARAEIIAPGITKTADVKEKALAAAYGTEEGKSVIDSLLSGKTFDSADKDMLFVAASELLKNVRRSQLNTGISLDALPSMKAGSMTPEKINEMNASHYGKN